MKLLLVGIGLIVLAVSILNWQPTPLVQIDVEPALETYHAPATITFIPRVTARGGRIVQYEWDFGDGSMPVKKVSPEAVKHTYKVNSDSFKTFTVTLRVRSENGKSGKISRDIVVAPAPPPRLTISSSPPLEQLQNLKPPVTIAFTATTEQDKFPEVQVKDEDCIWKLIFPNGTQKDQKGKKAQFSLTQAGTYELVASVTNTGGRITTKSLRIIVMDPDPCKIRNFSLDRTEGEYPLTVKAMFIAYHPKVRNLSYEIDWGDGTAHASGSITTDQEQDVEHTYTKPGQYTVKLTVFSQELGREKTKDVESQQILVKHHFHYMMPSWSSNFKKIAFVYRDDSKPNIYEIHIATLDASQDSRGTWEINGTFTETNLFTMHSADKGTNLCPSWSPSGDALVIMSDTDGQEFTDLYEITAKETKKRLTWTEDAVECCPVWMPSPEQNYIIFSSNRDHKEANVTYTIPGLGGKFSEAPEIQLPGIYELYRLNLDTGGISRLSYSSYSHRWPTPSPDGTKIAFEMKGDIYSADFDKPDSNVAIVVGTPWTETYPRWNPKFKNLLAFMREKNGRWETVIYDLRDGTETTVTKETETDVMYPSWSPDGRFIVCQKRTIHGWRLAIYQVADTNGNISLGPEILLQPATQK